MRFFRTLKRLITIQTLVIATLSTLTTELCIRHGITAEFPLSLIATAVVFPIVFSIGGAYKRREAALDEYSRIKANGRSIFFAARDWAPESDEPTQAEVKELLKTLFEDMRQLFNTPLGQMEEKENDIYTSFSSISRFISGLKTKGLGSGDCARCAGHLTRMMVAFENIKHIYQYRTPRTLRTFSHLFIYTLPVIYGPYFAYISQEFSPNLEFVTPALFSIILVCLDNILDHLENPFDLDSEDDVIIKSEKFVGTLEL